jgi:disulfide bond formation protein DsbB
MAERYVLAALIGTSLAALALAWYVQLVLGHPPCSLCLRARWPHYVLVTGGALALYAGRPRLGLWLAVGALFAALAISLTHIGVEAGWLALPGGCVAQPGGDGLDDLRTALLAQTRPSCDQPSPDVFGVSMPQWHALATLTLALAAAWTLSVRGRQR